MNLENIVYLTIRPDGTVNSIVRNEKYFNHFQYLKDFSKQDEYLRLHSFGLTFTMNNNTPRFFFLKELASDGTIIYENLELLPSSKVSSALICLPEKISPKQKEILETLEKEISEIKNLFLEKYQQGINEMDCFESLNKTIEEVQESSQILKTYIDEHLVKTI